MESHAIARTIARSLIGHRNALAGKAEDAHKARTAFATAATAVGEHQADHKSAAAAATQYWAGKSADGFDQKARSMTAALADTASAAKRGAEIVTATAASLDTNHTAVARLVEEYMGKAVPLIDGARAAQTAGQRAAMLTAVGHVVDMVRDYTNESTKHVHAVRKEMTDAAGELHKLTKDVRHDGVESGVNIGILPFTGDVYNWGREHGLAYHSLDKARPGDVLLFGTGPQSPSTSTHIGIVESVHGGHVTMIEGNSADQVRRVTHPLSTSVFYGGVHPR